MDKLIRLKPGWALIVYTVLDALCVGMGMGVPIFCILLGFPVGWYIVGNITARTTRAANVFSKVLLYAAVAAAMTFIGMAILWGATAPMLFDPAADFVNFGIPMILYEPKASFVGWLVLMIFISPFLQFLMALFGAHLALWLWLQARGGD